MAFDHPFVLLLLLLCIPAALGRGVRWQGVSSLAFMPRDWVSLGLDAMLRALAAGAIAAIVLGLAGLHRAQSRVLHEGFGAHIVVVLDRSLSMDEPFARTGERADESKTAAAVRLLLDLFNRRPHDAFGLVAFSTAPIAVMPLTEHRDAVRAALAAMRGKALANTEIGGGLAYGLAMFAHDDTDAPRVLLFVSDGAGDIAQQTQDYLRSEAARLHVHLYYLYLRAGDDPALAEDMTGRDDPTRPAALDAFFRTLGVPYRGFEARSPDAVAEATRTIDQLERKPTVYAETLARRDFDAVCYAVGCACLGVFLAGRLGERSI